MRMTTYRMWAVAAMSTLLAAALPAPARADMMRDSPVRFPTNGCRPALFPPDVKTESLPSEKDYFLFGSPCRSPDQIARIQAEMPRGRFTAPSNDWRHLERTRRVLEEGGELHVLGLGDSIVNDTMRSGWLAKLAEAYPKARIRGTVYVRGGGGCHHYAESNRVERFVVPLKPDLVCIGGISQRSTDDIREAVHRIRAGLPEVEFLLATGTFGTADPRDAEALAKARHSGTGPYGEALRRLAAEERCAFLDMTSPWAEYIRSSGVHPHRFYRDAVHANEYGEQILARILTAFWVPGEAWLDIQGKATGSFHIETIGGRSLLVTPDGHGFVALGVNHLSAIKDNGEGEPDLFATRYGGDWNRFAAEVLRQFDDWGLNVDATRRANAAVKERVRKSALRGTGWTDADSTRSIAP